MLAAGVPIVGALSWAQAPSTDAGTTPAAVSIVAEQVATARDIVPFGVSRDGDRATVWASGKTRSPSVEPPGPPPPSTTPQSPSPDSTTPDATTPLDPVGERGQRAAEDATPTTPPGSLLLAGTTDGTGKPTAWERAAAPQSVDGQDLTARDWRPAGSDAPLHAGEATPNGAAALAVELGLATDAARAPGFLARRAADNRFRALPAPSAELLAPATALFDAATRTARLPFAVVDLPLPAGDPTTPPATDPGGTTPSPRVAPAKAETGVLLAPPGGDGVLAWTGSAWREEPYLDLAGERPAAGRTPIALAATPEGDGVALLRNSDLASPDRFRLYRRLADHSAWQEITLAEGSLLRGPLPSTVTAVEPAPAPGDPLTVAAGHWWVDLIATRDDTKKVSATVHLAPGQAVKPTTPDPTTPTTPESTPPASTPAVTTPTGTSPAETSPPTTAPTTPTATTPDSTPKGWLSATPDGTWCQPTLATCTHDLTAEFASSRGYRSQAFPGSGFGGRVITSPVVPESTGTDARREASASGGYLALTGTRFEIRDGVGDEGDGTSGTESAAFENRSSGWVGADRAVGHVGQFGDPLFADLAIREDATSAFNVSESLQDVVVSPDGTTALALSSGGSVYRKDPDAVWGYTMSSLRDYNEEGSGGTIPPMPRALAWPRADLMVAVGTAGLMKFTSVPPVEDYLISGPVSTGQQATEVTVREAAGLDLLDVAFAAGADPLDGWAVGRDGAALHCVDRPGKGGVIEHRCARVKPAGELATADFRQLAYAGSQALIASSAGLVKVKDGALGLDRDLAAMIEADGRPAGVRTVAGLPDGAAVVDARYARLSADGPWLRLPSPAEGDVIALALARRSDRSGIASLRVIASIADAVPARRGSLPDAQTNVAVSNGTENQVTEQPLNEVPPQIDDARLSQLDDGRWVDRNLGPIERSTGRDLAILPLPVRALTLIGSGDDARGFAVGGWGSGEQYSLARTSASFADEFAVRLDGGPKPPIADALARPATANRAQAPKAARAQVPSPTDPTSPPESAPAPTTGPRDDDLPGDGTRVRLLIGGHPACLDDCTGRSAQRVGPTETLKQALATARRIRLGRGGSPPVSATLIGGGRASVGGTPLSAAGADAFVALLGGAPYASSPPVFPVIGTGDASTDVGRSNFSARVAPAIAPPLVATTDPQTPPNARGSETVAYWFEVEGSPNPVRVIVIDNATGALRGTLGGSQADWIVTAIGNAVTAGKPAIVVGSARLDDRSPIDASETAGQLDLIARAGASAYVSTDGTDDLEDLSHVGPRIRNTVVETPHGAIPVIHSGALGHSIPIRVLYPNMIDFDEEKEKARREQRRDLSSQPALVALDIDQTKPGASPGQADVSATVIPVFRELGDSGTATVERSYAQPMWLQTLVDAGNGFRWTDPSRPELGEQDATGAGWSDATPDQCRLFLGLGDCGDSLPSDVRFEVADPSIAVFVRAKAARVKGRDRERDSFAVPTILFDAAGNPVVDSRSTILCPLRAGRTTITVTTAGRATRVPLRVIEPQRESERQPTAGSGGKSAPCSFRYFDRADASKAEPTAAKSKSLVPQPRAAFDPPTDRTKPKPKPSAPSKTIPAMTAPLGLVAPPMLTWSPPAAESARPPVAPNPKPITPPAPPAPPSGVTTQQVPVPNAAIVSIRQEERQTEVARESADHQATIYQAASRPGATTLLAGGAFALLIAAAGHAAGRRRRLTQAAKAWLR